MKSVIHSFTFPVAIPKWKLSHHSNTLLYSHLREFPLNSTFSAVTSFTVKVLWKFVYIFLPQFLTSYLLSNQFQSDFHSHLSTGIHLAKVLSHFHLTKFNWHFSVDIFFCCTAMFVRAVNSCGLEMLYLLHQLCFGNTASSPIQFCVDYPRSCPGCSYFPKFLRILNPKVSQCFYVKNTSPH